VVLDGVARAKECGRVSGEEGAELGPDREIHRSRIENRDRAIPGWYELTWDDVQRSREGWSPPDQVDLSLESTHSRATNRGLVADLLSRRGWSRSDGAIEG
jgi:hypothetical protein